jgi:threonine aldolase
VIAQAITDTPGLRLDPPDVETNILYFHIDRELGAAREMTAALKSRGVLVHPTGPQTIRICTHLDVSAAQAERAAETIRQTAGRLVPAK